MTAWLILVFCQQFIIRGFGVSTEKVVVVKYVFLQSVPVFFSYPFVHLLMSSSDYLRFCLFYL